MMTRAEVEDLDDAAPGDLVLRTILSHDLFRKQVCYGVIVECWEHKKAGRVRRLWNEQFTQAEQKLVSKYHTTFRDWVLGKGPPARVAVELKTIELLQRAVNFFATT